MRLIGARARVRSIRQREHLEIFGHQRARQWNELINIKPEFSIALSQLSAIDGISKLSDADGAANFLWPFDHRPALIDARGRDSTGGHRG